MYKEKIEKHIRTENAKITKMNKKEFLEKFTSKRKVFFKSKGSNKGKYETKENIKLQYESDLEKRFIEVLDKSPKVVAIMTQAIELEYHYWGKDRIYYPDIIYLTEKGQINILEIKPYESMLKIGNKIKYNKLKKYCGKKGFGYAMLEERGSLENIKNRNIKEELLKEMQEIMKQRNTIYHKRIPGLIKKHGVEFEDIMRIAIEENWQFRSPRNRIWSYSIKRQKQKDIKI